MKKFVILATLMAVGSAFAQVHVNGYYRKDGTYVAPHYRSAPDSSRLNNYSTAGNVNPYTGRTGTVTVDTFSSPYSRNMPPSYPSASTLTAPTCYVGPRGGTYTITPSGAKNYSGC